MMQTGLDLRQLAFDRSSAMPKRPRRRRHWISRYLVPGGVLLGFAALLTVAARDRLFSGQPVLVVPVVVTRAETQQEGTPLFQAAGWVEPRPTPVNVAALTEGVIEELLVVEGQNVVAGEEVARLVDADAKLALRQAMTSHELRMADLQKVEADLKAAQLRVDHPLHLEAALVDAQALLAKNETDRAQLPFLIESAEARLTFAKQSLDGKLAAKDALPGRSIQEAHSDLTDAKARRAELGERAPRLEREGEVLSKKVDVLSTQLRLLIDESQELESAKARQRAVRASLADGELAVEKAQLALDRTVVKAPITGRVLKLIAHPGSRVMGLDSSAALSSSTVVALYDPRMLQVRADVRLEDVPLVQIGQPVQLETASSKEPIAGTVLLATSIANIQKNTLEVKVAINDPPSTIRPEMLVTATFLAPAREKVKGDEPQRYERMLVPRQLVESSEAGTAIWIVAADGTAQRPPIKLGRAGTEELVEVIEGLRPTDKLISSGHQGLEPGERVRISGEDTTIGTSGSRS